MELTGTITSLEAVQGKDTDARAVVTLDNSGSAFAILIQKNQFALGDAVTVKIDKAV